MCKGVKYLIETNRDLSLVGLFPLTENIITPKSLKSGDIITSHSGKTVEILDTDAEGRLVVADALSYSSLYKPERIIDLTTITSTNITCYDNGVFFTLNKNLKNKIEEISYKMKEDLSPLPSIIHKTMLYSTVADIKNISLNCQKKKGAGAYIAAMFLHEFVPKNTKEWIHFDISNEIYEDLDKDIIMPNGKCIRTIIEIIKK